jgi:hypothetical protein
MNKLLIGVFSLIWAILLHSCYKDKGSYSYQEINSIGIEDKVITDKIFVQPGTSLQITPTLQLNGNEDDLSFQWFVYLNSASASYVQDSTLIATSRSLDYIVDPSVFTIGEDYKLTYKVTSNKTGVSYFYFYQLSISDKYTVGWVYLEDNAGKGDLSMILRNGEIYRNIYSGTNPEYPLTNPKSFTISASSISDGVARDGKRFYITAQNDGIELDGLTMKKRFDYNYLFFIPPDVVNPSYIGWAGGAGNVTGILINNGILHTNLVGGFPGAKKFGAPLASPNNAYDYELVPQTISGQLYADNYQIIMFDRKNRRFYDVKYNGLRAFDDAAQDLGKFDLNDLDMDLIKLDSSNNIEIRNGIMKDNQDNVFLLQFRTSRATNPVITHNKQEINSPNITKAMDVTCSTVSPHIYYVADAKLYKYEVSSNTYTTEHSFASNEIATKIKFEKHGYGNAQPRLIVCTWNGVEGKVHYFKVNPNGTVGALDQTYTGFGKIIDLAYKY